MPIAESFATLVALIGQFRSEKAEKEKADFSEFTTWLAQTNHEEIKNLLLMNTKATTAINEILNQDREVVLESLNRIDVALAAFASSIQGFGQLAEGLNPDSVLSSQALSILHQFEISRASKMLVIETMAGNHYQFVDGTGDVVEIEDQRFAEDDLNTLVELGLLRGEYNSSGKPIYAITRRASQLVSSKDT